MLLHYHLERGSAHTLCWLRVMESHYLHSCVWRQALRGETHGSEVMCSIAHKWCSWSTNSHMSHSRSTMSLLVKCLDWSLSRWLMFFLYTGEIGKVPITQHHLRLYLIILTFYAHTWRQSKFRNKKMMGQSRYSSDLHTSPIHRQAFSLAAWAWLMSKFLLLEVSGLRAVSYPPASLGTSV